MGAHNIFQKFVFRFAHQLMEGEFEHTYQKMLHSQWRPYSEQKKEQERELKQMIIFAYKNVPYYHKLFNELKLDPSDIKTTEDLEKLPQLTKEIVKNNWEEFKPVNLDTMKYYINSTGGSTGTPFQYRLLKYDRFLLGALLYRGWGYAGYELGDKMIFLAGSSLDAGSKSIIIKKVDEMSRNIRKLSSYDMSNEDMQQYAKVVNSFKPKFIRGYPSSINLFANFIDENNINISTPKGIFTAAEKLTPDVRKNIANVFDCEVYDAYGLNDGGVSAFECPEHSGLHIDTERSIMEIVDDNGMQVEDRVGKILATSLYNYAMPFIRYDTGDIGYTTGDVCGCGRESKILKEIMGRTVDILLTPDGKNVHGYFIQRIFREYGGAIKEYQVIQEKIDKLVINIVPEEGLNEKQLDTIREIIGRKSGEWVVEFKYVDKIERTKAGKYKFIERAI